MVAGPSANLYSIGGDPLTQLIFLNYIFLNFVFFIRNADSDQINGEYVVGDPLTTYAINRTVQHKNITSTTASNVHRL